MDPAAYICQIQDSFNADGDTVQLHTYVNSGHIEPKMNQEEGSYPISFTRYEDVYQYPEIFDPIQSHPKFQYKDSIILADIDSVFNLTDQYMGYIIKQNLDYFTFVSIGQEYAEYLQYRRPNSFGFVKTSDKLDSSKSSSKDSLDVNRLSISYCDDGFIENVRRIEALGVDLVVSTSLSSREFLQNLLIVLGSIKIGGHYICQLSSLDDPLMIELLYITSDLFEEISLFKPLADNALNDRHYLVCKYSKTNNIDWSDYLAEITDQDKSIVKTVSPKFIKWIQDYQRIVEDRNQFLQSMKGKRLYNTFKCWAIWNLP